ncbi:hypothetical protein CMI47_15935 [Candidatus Pacearchaeota archaeon]|nr:hypothetical protein [Candidatus Pacearchaeota archaeon]
MVRIDKLNSRIKEIQKEIKKFQDACKHKYKHIKTVRAGTTVYVCDNCERELRWPSPDELDAWMRK